MEISTHNPYGIEDPIQVDVLCLFSITLKSNERKNSRNSFAKVSQGTPIHTHMHKHTHMYTYSYRHMHISHTEAHVNTHTNTPIHKLINIVKRF